MMVEATFSWRRIQAIAMLAMPKPRVLCDGQQLLDRREEIVRAVAVHHRAHLVRGRARVLRRRLARACTCRSALPGASGDQTICEMPCSSQKGISSASGARQIMLYCGWEETNFFVFGTSSARLDLLDGPLGEADLARLARLADLGERLHRLLDRRVGVGAVALVEVDVVGLQALQRFVDLLVDLLAGEAASASSSSIWKKSLVARMKSRV